MFKENVVQPLLVSTSAMNMATETVPSRTAEYCTDAKTHSRSLKCDLQVRMILKIDDTCPHPLRRSR